MQCEPDMTDPELVPAVLSPFFVNMAYVIWSIIILYIVVYFISKFLSTGDPENPKGRRDGAHRGPGAVGAGGIHDGFSRSAF